MIGKIWGLFFKVILRVLNACIGFLHFFIIFCKNIEQYLNLKKRACKEHFLIVSKKIQISIYTLFYNIVFFFRFFFFFKLFIKEFKKSPVLLELGDYLMTNYLYIVDRIEYFNFNLEDFIGNAYEEGRKAI